MTTNLKLPERKILVRHALRAIASYSEKNEHLLLSLPIQTLGTDNKIKIPLKLASVELPEWAFDCGVNGTLLVPQECCLEAKTDWAKIDWWLAIFLMLECWHERIWEKLHGPIHSYSFRLKGWDTRVWDHAWVNRIALFLRKWVAIRNEKSCEELLGPPPLAKIKLSFDVDAVFKTMPIRIKQGCFNLFNCFRYTAKFNLAEALMKLWKALRFFFGFENWWKFERLLNKLQDHGSQAQFNFYGGKCYNLKSWFMDPCYDLKSERLQHLLMGISKKGHSIGLHPSFDSWFDEEKLKRERTTLEQSSKCKITHSRQHWLRFQWSRTFRALTNAGISNDSTVMFNDRAGFRTSACIDWHPWDQNQNKPYKLRESPPILMDSHLHDYSLLDDSSREKEMKHWFHECRIVGGVFFVVWHPHTLTDDYGWCSAFHKLLAMEKENI